MAVRLAPAPVIPDPARKRRRWLIWVAVLAVVLIGSGIGVLHSSWLSVHEIDIRGAEQADVAGRVAAAGVGEGAIMLWVSPGELEAAVLADPWVREARVQRVLPDTLVVDVLEHTPLLWVEGASSWMLVSRDGSVLENVPAAEDGLLRVSLSFRDYGPGELPEDPTWTEVLELAHVLDPALAAGFTLEEAAGVASATVDGTRFDFGPPVDLADKGRVMMSMLAEEVPAGWSVDLVAPRRPALVPPSMREQAELKVEAPRDGAGVPSDEAQVEPETALNS